MMISPASQISDMVWSHSGKNVDSTLPLQNGVVSHCLEKDDKEGVALSLSLDSSDSSLVGSQLYEHSNSFLQDKTGVYGDSVSSPRCSSSEKQMSLTMRM